MNYTLMPSLEHSALIKITITLLNQDDIRVLFACPYFSLSSLKRREKRQEIEDKVTEKLLQLSLPELFKKKILGFVNPIGLQIFKWQDENSYFGIDLPNELCWTPQGTVDKKRTAEVLIKDENLDITTRYKLACTYCLEDNIPELWNRIPENLRNSFEEECIKEYMVERYGREQELVAFWTYNIKGEVDKLMRRKHYNRIERQLQLRCSPYQYAFYYTAMDANKAATEYFLQKLTSRERELLLIVTAQGVAHLRCNSSPRYCELKNHTDVLCFLLSQMNKEQQIEVFKTSDNAVLVCLLDWPWQSLFMETASCMGAIFFYFAYSDTLQMIIVQEKQGYKDCNYRQLFGEFWKQIPSGIKREILGFNGSIGFLLSELFKIEDEENVRLILKNATIKQKEEIIFLHGKDICKLLIYSNKWDLLKFFVQECISSKEVMIKFKEEFKFCQTKKELESELWSKCFNLLDDIIHKDGKKRSMEEGESNPAKRLHSAEFEEVTHLKVAGKVSNARTKTQTGLSFCLT